MRPHPYLKIILKIMLFVKRFESFRILNQSPVKNPAAELGGILAYFDKIEYKLNIKYNKERWRK
ncbi:MAG: hypothetical protein A2169_08755 [Deltaproteobacteria bacterium RBG_13_47_9]|nr:MAG: hypothetical protein A2169_08755 [Deltaproteobacteria bacterium RBG_13_47_9]